jgi:hypothetical protein
MKIAVYIHRPEYGGSRCLLNLGKYLLYYTVQHPRRQPSPSPRITSCHVYNTLGYRRHIVLHLSPTSCVLISSLCSFKGTSATLA